MEEDEEYDGTVTKQMPRPSIVKYHDFLGKLWGWDRLIPKALYVSWPDYSAYLEEYHRRNVAAVRDMADLAEACLVNEEQLVSEWKKNRMTSGEGLVLPMRKSIVLSCLIHQRARSVIVRAYLGAVLDGAPRFRKSTLRDDVSGAALLCIAKEADLTRELLRRGADRTDDYLIALRRGIISDVLNSQSKKDIEGGEKSKRKEESLLEKLWGWERLLPLHGSVKWSDYGDGYLEEYYKHNAYELVANAAAANQNPEDSQIATNAEMGAAVVRFCVEMEEELQSKWKIRVRLSTGDTLPVSTIIQSGLIKEFALSICGRGGEICVPSAVAFVCIAKEAELMCELLKHGAKPSDDIVQKSSVIRMCALGLVNHLRGHHPAALVAAMVSMANEATKMCGWMKRENKLVTFSLSEPNELEECRLIRIKTLDVMTSILHEYSFPSSKMRNAALAYE